jgi:hypothetical protein
MKWRGCVNLTKPAEGHGGPSPKGEFRSYTFNRKKKFLVVIQNTSTKTF